MLDSLFEIGVGLRPDDQVLVVEDQGRHAALLTRYEVAARPEALRWGEWIEGQLDKVACGLADLERRASAFGDRVDVGTISFACSLGYLDFRFASLAWRERHPNAAAWYEWFAGRESMVATRPG